MTGVATQDNHAPPPRRSSRKVALLLAASIAFALGIVEVAFRTWGLGRAGYEPRRFDSPTGGVPFEIIPIEGDPRFFAYRPNCSFASIYDPRGDTRGYFKSTGRVEYRIDAMRMRGPALLEPRGSGLRVLCLGDSFTFGEGVHEQDTYPARLHGLLNKSAMKTPVEVLNAGVQAYGTRQELAFFKRFGRALKPDVVTLGFVLNDACDVAETISQNDAMTRPFEPSGPGRVSAVWRSIELKRHQSQLQEAFFRQIRRGFVSDEWDECKEALAEFHTMAEQDGFKFLVVIFPVFWQLDGDYPFEDLHAKVSTACREALGDVIDLREQFRDRPSSDFWVHPTDQHPNELVHERAAQAISLHITELNVKSATRPAP